METHMNQSPRTKAAIFRSRGQSGVALITVLLILLLVSSVIVGIYWLTMTDQQLGGNAGNRQTAFYGAEAGMEKLTADLSTLFASNYSPTAAQVNALMTTPPAISGVQYLAPNGSSGYLITFNPDSNGNPLATTSTIQSGPYQGLVGLVTPYNLTVTARTQYSSEVKLARTTETVGIPVFQFGVFSQTDLSFFAGPNFNFGGRVHTNGNLWLGEGDGNTLTLASKTTAVGEVIRTNLSNSWPLTSNYNGVVQIAIVPGGTSYVTQGMNQGSLVKSLLSATNEPAWTQFSLGTSNGMELNYVTGVTPLTLAIAMPSLGGFPIDLIRRPVQGEDASNPAKLGERYYAQASLRIQLSDNPADITSLPCRPAGGAPIPLNQLAQSPPNKTQTWYTGGIPLAASNSSSPTSYSSSDGYWFPQGTAIITGYIEIDAQTSYGVPCGTWQDVTKEILNLGVAAKNLNPVPTGTRARNYPIPPTLANPPLPASQISANPGLCTDPSTNAVIRFEHVRDNPSTTTTGGCGGTPTSPYDYWPSALFDAREGNLRDGCPTNSNPCTANPTPAGVMYYVELDVANLGKWFQGTIGSSGPLTKDPNNAPNDFVVYFSDRRTNYFTGSTVSGWPPLSPSGKESGEYGADDFVNPGSAYGCPNLSLDTGEDLDSVGALFNYGQAPFPYATYAFPPTYPLAFLKNAPALTADPNCSVASSIAWPGMFYAQAADARENPPLFFRRALKLVNASIVNMGMCPGGVNCGLTIVAENPIYVQGDYNAPAGSFTSPYGAASIVADAITLLSDAWNDVNSFAFPYNPGNRQASNTSYRFGAEAGKGISFPQPSGTPQDFGTDGGVHNFMRFLEGWGGIFNFRGSLVSLYYNRQAVGTYKCCTTVYSPPTRTDNFDTDFLTPALLPPRTPMFRDVDTTGFTQLLFPNQ
jgi:hypothetical protein